MTNTDLTTRLTDDYTLSATPVTVASYNTADITVTAVTDAVIEGHFIAGHGVEAFISCITPNAAVYNIEEPSCAIVYIKGNYL